MGEAVLHSTKKRKLKGPKKNSKPKKTKLRNSNDDVVKPKKIDKKLKKMLMRKARDYNSDTDDDNIESGDDENENAEVGREKNVYKIGRDERKVESSDDDDGDERDKEDASEDEDEEGSLQPGVTKLTEGCKAFRMVFRKIIKETAGADGLGPVLSAYRKLVAEKLSEEAVERKAKDEAKKEKHVVAERGHAKPANYLDTHEKFLISVATKGVVKLFNAVNKAQHAQKGLNPSRAKDEKAIKKRRKEVFFSELGKSSSQSGETTSKAGTSSGTGSGSRPAWAPLRDDFMLSSSKLKDWDKKQDTANEDDSRSLSETDSSSDED